MSVNQIEQLDSIMDAIDERTSKLLDFAYSQGSGNFFVVVDREDLSRHAVLDNRNAHVITLFEDKVDPDQDFKLPFVAKASEILAYEKDESLKGFDFVALEFYIDKRIDQLSEMRNDIVKSITGNKEPIFADENYNLAKLEVVLAGDILVNSKDQEMTAFAVFDPYVPAYHRKQAELGYDFVAIMHQALTTPNQSLPAR